MGFKCRSKWMEEEVDGSVSGRSRWMEEYAET